MKFISNFTFLLPVYNGGKDFDVILKSLEGLNSATHVIIYNDGSTDGSYQLACRYAESSKHNVRVIDGIRNRGYFRVIKILLRICPTRFYLFLGHDDQLSPNYLDNIDRITAENKNAVCIFSNIAAITPGGAILGTWPNAPDGGNNPVKISCMDAARTFNKAHWGNLFVAIWDKGALNHRTLLKIMRCIPGSPLVAPLKLSGFLNDNMAVLRTLSANERSIIYHNREATYYKEVDPERISEGAQQFKKDNVLHNPMGYLSIVAHFMLPQIAQRSLAIRWFIEYLVIYFGVSVKRLISQPSAFSGKIFANGIALIFSAAANALFFKRKS